MPKYLCYRSEIVLSILVSLTISTTYSTLFAQEPKQQIPSEADQKQALAVFGSPRGAGEVKPPLVGSSPGGRKVSGESLSNLGLRLLYFTSSSYNDQN